MEFYFSPYPTGIMFSGKTDKCLTLINIIILCITEVFSAEDQLNTVSYFLHVCPIHIASIPNFIQHSHPREAHTLSVFSGNNIKAIHPALCVGR